jgi:hypothetical protein
VHIFFEYGKTGDVSIPSYRTSYRESGESGTPDNRPGFLKALFFIPSVSYETAFATAVRTYLGLGNAVRFSKDCVTVVIDLGGKIFYDKLFFRENGAWPAKTRSFSFFPS